MSSCFLSCVVLLLCCHVCCAGVRLDWVTANLEVLLPHSAAAAVQSLASPLLQPYGFSLQPGTSTPSAGTTSSCCSSSQAAGAASPATAAHTSAAVLHSPSSAAAAAGDDEATSSYDELIKASSNPAALLGRLLEKAPNLARAPSSSKGSTSLSLGLSPYASLVKPASRLKPLAGQQLPGLASGSAQQQQQQDVVAIDVSRLAPPLAAAAAGGASSSAAGVPGSAAGGVVAAGLAVVQEGGAEGYKFSIEGMSCGSCVKSVEAAVAKVSVL